MTIVLGFSCAVPERCWAFQQHLGGREGLVGSRALVPGLEMTAYLKLRNGSFVVCPEVLCLTLAAPCVGVPAHHRGCWGCALSQAEVRELSRALCSLQAKLHGLNLQPILPVCFIF